MVLLLLADGFEEIEALTPVDVLRRAGVEIKTVGVSSRVAIGSHGIPVVCDLTADEVSCSLLDMVILPGGMPGAENLDKSAFVDKIIRETSEAGGRLAAICAAPLCLGRRGLLEGKHATCYPGFEGELHGAKIAKEGVVTDGSITTAKGMGVALDFALELTRLLTSEKKALEIERSLQKDGGVLIADKEDKSNPESDEYTRDKQFIAVVELAVKQGKITTADIQRNLAIGYAKAAKLIDIMEDMGIVSELDGRNPRKALITADEWQKMLERITN